MLLNLVLSRVPKIDIINLFSKQGSETSHRLIKFNCHKIKIQWWFILVISTFRGVSGRRTKASSGLAWATWLCFHGNLHLCFNDGTFWWSFLLWGIEVSTFQAFCSISMVSLSHSWAPLPWCNYLLKIPSLPITVLLINSKHRELMRHNSYLFFPISSPF